MPKEKVPFKRGDKPRAKYFIYRARQVWDDNGFLMCRAVLASPIRYNTPSEAAEDYQELVNNLNAAGFPVTKEVLFTVLQYPGKQEEMLELGVSKLRFLQLQAAIEQIDRLPRKEVQ